MNQWKLKIAMTYMVFTVYANVCSQLHMGI